MLFSEDDERRHAIRATNALAILRQEVDKVLEIEPTLLNIVDLKDLPEEKASAIEEQLWSIFAYGEYYVEKVISDMPELLESAKSKIIEYMYFYKHEYEQINQKTQKLIKVKGLVELSKALGHTFCVSREDIEWEIVYLEMRNQNSDSLPEEGDINQHLDSYGRRALTGWLKNCVRDRVEAQIEIDYSAYKYSVQKKTEDPDEIERLVAERFKEWKVSPVHSMMQKTIVRKGNFERVFEATIILRQCAVDSLEVVAPSFTKALDRIQGVDPGKYKYWEDEQTESWIESYWSEDIGKDLFACKHLLHRPYFDPASWTTNEGEFPAFVIEKYVPDPVKVRLHEIRRSFIFGNWMSVVALSRGVLEYVLIDTLKRKGEEHRIYKEDDGKKSRIKGVSDLAEIAEEHFRELKASMQQVIIYGNHVIHPYPNTSLSKKFEPDKKDAKSCLKNINKIVSALYSK